MKRIQACIAFAFLLIAQSVFAANHYVRSGASGAGSGSDWNNAYTSLPANLVRGDTYYVASGTYPAYTFDDPVSGTTTITIKKATASDHGTSVGWQAAYGSGQAAFSSILRFATGFYVFDGATRNESDWFDAASYGFRVNHNNQDQNIIIANQSGKASNGVQIKYVYVDAIYGNLPSTTIRRYAIDTDTYGGETGTGLVFHRMFVRGSNNVWFLRTTNGAVVEYSASDGVQSNSANHGEIVNLYYSGNNAVVRYNQWRNAYSVGSGGTALVAITQADGLKFYGNVLYNFQVGDGAVGFDGYSSSHNRIYNNTFVKGFGYNAGMRWGSGTDNLSYNNLFINCTTVAIEGTHDYNGFSDANARGEANAQTGIPTSLFVNYAGLDFRLASPTSPGMVLTDAQFQKDMLGSTRGADGRFDRGAYEYGGTSTAPSPTPAPTAAPTISPTATPSGWVFCANEWAYCSFSGTRTVRFGAQGKYVTKTLTGGTACNTTVFGDPIPGVAKVCELAQTTTSPAPTATPTPAPTATPAPSASPTTQSLFKNQNPAQLSNSDGASVNYELGLRFSTKANGRIDAIRFYKSPSETGTHVGRIWSSSGALLASVTFTNETASGWQQAKLATPLAITAGTEYVVSVNTGNTYYVATLDALTNGLASGDLTVPSNGGVYGSPGQRPTNTFKGTNYFRDVVFVRP